jgi:hypothetical protein
MISFRSLTSVICPLALMKMAVMIRRIATTPTVMITADVNL